MAIFNSLGSNYNIGYVIKSLFENGSNKDADGLKKLLEQRYGGKAILFYKGREALSAALKILDFPKNALVAINGFTCVAVYKAIEVAGFTPLCLDLEKGSNLNFTADTLRRALRKNKNIKVVVVQNTLGYPCDIEEIEQVCKKNKLILIEDLAHCVGTKYKNGKEAGTLGDFAILSFSQDKIIDAVSGGALVIRNKKLVSAKSLGAYVIHLPGGNLIKDRFYPYFSYKIRFLYNFGLGKPYYFALKTFNFLSNIMDYSFYSYFRLPNHNARLALNMFENLNKQLNHRKKISKIYFENLPEKILFHPVSNYIDLSSNLRFPILVENRTGLIKFLKTNKVFVSDIWYDDVTPECPNADEISKKILNLPTHINVQEKDALRICELINTFFKVQP